MFSHTLSRWRCAALASIFTLCLLLALTGCTKNEDSSPLPTNEEESLSPPSGTQSETPPKEDDATSAHITEQTEETQNPNSSSTESKASFSDTVLLGNSYVDCFQIYNSLPDAQYYYRVGLNVKTAFEKPMTNGSDTHTPVIELLRGKSFQHIVLFFGENELGWPNRDVFVSRYEQVIDAARTYCPNATIYLAGLPPVSAAVSNQNTDNLNNTAIGQCNDLLIQLAKDKTAVYIDTFSALANADGCLPDEAAADGIHPAREYTEKWAQLIQTSIEERDLT